MIELLNQYPVLLAPIVFLARVADVSLGTFRTIVVFRGHRWLAAAIGFFETIIWLLAAAQVLKNIDEWYLLIAYAGGFAAGNYVGMWLESHFAIGTELIRCISYNRDTLAVQLRDDGYQAISIDGDLGDDKPIEVIFIIAKRRLVPEIIDKIKNYDPGAIYSVSDIKSVYEGPDPLPRRSFLDAAFTLSGKRH
jgi:uncharacterized protein YebE (UPF0316 family)